LTIAVRLQVSERRSRKEVGGRTGMREKERKK